MSNDQPSKATKDAKAKQVEESNKGAISPKNEVKSNDLASKIPEKDKIEGAEERKSETAQKSPATKPRKSAHKQHFPWVTTFALLLVVVLSGGNYWLYQQGEQLKQAIAHMAQQQSESSQQVTNLGEQIGDAMQQQNSLAEQVQKNVQAQQSIIASMDQMSQQLKSLATTRGKDPLFWRVSEVEYLLSVANQRLALERDVLTAKVALQDADKRLRTIGDPGLIPVREKIAQELTQLENVNVLDIPGMAAQISSLADNLDQLPFVKKAMSLEAPPSDKSDKEFSGFSNFVKQIWEDLVNGLFKVQRSDQAIEPLLPPEEKQYLLHNLALKLEQARIALLQSETILFQKNLADIERWIEKYFDQNDASVTNILETVKSLKIIELKPALPDISASLRELRNWLDRQKNAAYQLRDSSVALLRQESISP